VRYLVRVGQTEHEVLLDGEGVHIDGEDVAARVLPIDGTPVQMVTIGNEVHRVLVRRGAERGQYTIRLDGYRFDVEALDERTRAIRELSGGQTAATGPAPLVAPMPGLIVRVTAQVGDRGQAGQGVVVMEAMKMENELRAQTPGSVKAVRASPGDTVEKGAVLIELE
jgi:pyruvate carboxylase subunit B